MWLQRAVTGLQNKMSVFTEAIRRLRKNADLLRQVIFSIPILPCRRAEDTIVCQIKPMTHINVIPYNMALNDFLNSQVGGYGISTQIRMRDIKPDAKGNGFHILPDFVSVLDRTYACAIRGILVPCPTPMEDFLPEQVRSRWEAEWPRVGGPMNHHGW